MRTPEPFGNPPRSARHAPEAGVLIGFLFTIVLASKFRWV